MLKCIHRETVELQVKALLTLYNLQLLTTQRLVLRTMTLSVTSVSQAPLSSLLFLDQACRSGKCSYPSFQYELQRRLTKGL